MKQKMKQLMGILISLVMVLEGAGGLTVCAAEQTEPNAIEQRLKIDDVTYYNAKSWSFASSTQQFYYDLLSAPVDDSENGWAFQFSRAELWMYLALCLDPGCPDRDFLYMESVIKEHKLSPLKYIYNNGKDEFYTGIWYNGRHYDVFFRNLGIVALQPDASVKGNYISTTIDSSKSDGTYVSSVRNESNSYVTQTIDDSESGTVTMSNSVNGSESYSYTEGIKVGYEYDGIFNNVSAEISFSATQALQNGWSKSNTESKTYTNGTHNTRTVPPYSAAVMETGSSDIEVTTRYNCPVGLTYSVDILTGGTNDWNPDTDPNATTWNGKKYTFGPDARKDIFQRWLINGNSLTNLDREKIDWRWVGYGRRGISDNQWLIVPLSKYVPVSSAGAVIRETKNSTKTTCKEFVPLHPLKTIKIETPPDGTAIAGKISYDSYDYLQMSLPMGKSSNTRYFTLGGYNSQGGIFSTFNKDFGHWIVVDENGRELGGDAPVTLDSATGKFTAVSPGKCYLKYLIEEDKYVSADTGERYLTNRDIEKPAIMEITVEEPEYTNKLEITGSYTGIVGMASESIEGEGKLQGGVFDETGEEVAEPYIWKARQLPSRGINLTEDGTVSFTKPGTFQVRIMTPDKKHYSEWYDVTAKRGDDSSYIIDDDDLPPVIDDEDYRIADKSAVIFVEGSFDGSANGEAVSLEGKDKLTVYAEDLSGQELPIKYEWEQMENEGLVLSKDGKAVFTKPGNYFVRVRSGEIYSDWVEITAKVPAEVKRAPVAIDRVFDGRTRNLVEPGVAVGGKIAYVVMIDPWSVPSEASFEEKWASEIPAATDAGTYYVWYKVVGDDNHNDTEPVCVSVKIDKANATAATVTANNRAYDGTEQPLVTVSGEPTGGEMQYAIGTATEATQPYTTSIPTATEAGTYYVWYKVVGDTNHTDTAAECAVTVIVPVFGPATFTLPASTKSVGESAFEGLPMTIVEIPSGCTSIGAKAFKDCANLTQIRIPASVTSIDTTAFEGCEKVLVYGTADSAAQTFCADHANCTFVAEN
jgi:methionine-rich copper-binding protein CopC